MCNFMGLPVTAATLITWMPSTAWKRAMGALLAAQGQSQQRPWGPLPAWSSAAGRISRRQLGRASSLRHFLSEATRSCCLTELNKAAAGSH